MNGILERAEDEPTAANPHSQVHYFVVVVIVVCLFCF
jgi:hypothetical protein